MWYGNLVHNWWTLTQYFFYFVYGAVWADQYDMALAIGIYFRTIFQISLEDAQAAAIIAAEEAAAAAALAAEEAAA